MSQTSRKMVAKVLYIFKKYGKIFLKNVVRQLCDSRTTFVRVAAKFW